MALTQERSKRLSGGRGDAPASPHSLRAAPKPRALSSEELMSILRERPSGPRESFSKAIGAVIRSYEGGHISAEETEVLLRVIVAHHISTTMEDWIDSAVVDLFESARGRTKLRRHDFLPEVSDLWFSRED